MSNDYELERKITDFLRQNGKSKALTIAKGIQQHKSTVNRHLYNLERSNQVFRSNEKPPVWDLMEKTLTTTSETCEEKDVKDLLRSGGLKAYHIATALGQPTKTVKKQIQTGKVKKCDKSSLLNDEESNESHNQESDYRLGSVAGLSQSFDVITVLGKGNFGCVYKVKHKFDGKIYAVKKVDLTGEADSEVKALASLDHPNIVRYITCWPDSENCTSNQDQVSKTSGSSSGGVIYDRAGCEEKNDDEDDDDDDDDDEDDDDDDDEDDEDYDDDDVTSGMESLDGRTYLFIQMEFCAGGTLTEWINARQQRTTMDINKIFYEIISGVEYIHSNKLIHRDLKPDNILFCAEGKVKIGDFGLVAAQANENGDPIERSNTGTPTYMSPEQLLTNLKKQKRFPKGFCDSYPTENKFIKKMLSSTPEDRPDAKDIKEKLEKFFSSLDHNPLRSQENATMLSQSFEVITKLGKGGFGCVYKVKHKFDGKIYAVKKVVLTGNADSEVKALARLDHPNIVRYNTCWSDSTGCEERDDDDVSDVTSGMESLGVRGEYVQLSWDVNTEAFTVLTTATAKADSEVMALARLDHRHTVCYNTCWPDSTGCEEKDDEDEDEDDVFDVTSGMESLGVTADGMTHLFIQMEFCEGGTLTTWIKARNLMNEQRTTVEIHKIFYEIVSGVEYIHSNNLIHRDLKPDNILFSSDGQVKIGDFGLVVPQTNENGDPIERSNKGTPPYMSPEQKNGRNYDQKTDIFPLGLIWFEILWKISSGSERAKLWPDLRNQKFPEGFCESYQTENKFIKKMLSSTPEGRPDAKDIKEKLEMFFSLDQNLLSQKTV